MDNKANISVSDEEFEQLSKDRANFQERLAKWLGDAKGGHSTQKIVEAMKCSYGNCYNALTKLEKEGIVETAYSGRVKIWRLVKNIETK